MLSEVAPNPVSMSTSSGVGQTRVIRRASCTKARQRPKPLGSAGVQRRGLLLVLAAAAPHLQHVLQRRHPEVRHAEPVERHAPAGEVHAPEPLLARHQRRVRARRPNHLQTLRRSGAAVSRGPSSDVTSAPPPGLHPLPHLPGPPGRRKRRPQLRPRAPTGHAAPDAATPRWPRCHLDPALEFCFSRHVVASANSPWIELDVIGRCNHAHDLTPGPGHPPSKMKSPSTHPTSPCPSGSEAQQKPS